mgnify:CR=1 FL=1
MQFRKFFSNSTFYQKFCIIVGLIPLADMLKKLILTLIIGALSSIIIAQETTITGQIKDESGFTIPGATVVEKGTTNLDVENC